MAGVASLTMVFSSIPTVFAAETNPIEITGTHSATSSDTSTWWQPIDSAFLTDKVSEKADVNIVVDPSITYQQYEGIGISLDETSVSNLWKLGEKEDGTYDMDKIEGIVKMLCSPEEGAGFELFRLTIGSPDCIEHIPFWSYDDMPHGEEDWNLEHFSIEKDITYHIIDTAKLIQKYNPDVKFFASAWSAPGWMTTTDSFVGKVNADNTDYNDSELRDDCIEVFAEYYAKYVEAYAEQGIDIYAITELNEPGCAVPYPSMQMTIEQQQKLAIAIKNAFAAHHLDTKLWMNDFNFWDWKNPESTETKNYYRVFENTEAGQLGNETFAAADGVAFHPYWGDASAMKDAFNTYGLPVYLTEAGGMDPGTVLSYFRLNCSSYAGWAMITDQRGGTLHWTNGTQFIPEENVEEWAKIGARNSWPNRLIVAHQDTKEPTYASYFGNLGQMAKYLDAGATRVYSSDPQNGVTNATYINKDNGDTVEYVMVLNNTGNEKTVNVSVGGKTGNITIARGFTTLTWTMPKGNTEGNTAPVIDPIDPIVTGQYETLTYRVTATDDQHDTVKFYALEAPSGVAVNPKTGEVTWTPSSVGEFDIVIAATDGVSHSETTMHIVVESAPLPVPGRLNVGESATEESNSSSVYEINAAAGGTYLLTVNYTTAGAVTDQAVTVVIDGEEVVTKTLTTATNNNSMIMPIDLTAGIHEISVKYTGIDFTVNYLNIAEKTDTYIPATIEAENYKDGANVTLSSSRRTTAISMTDISWAEYDLKSLAEGEFVVSANAATTVADVVLTISVDGEEVATLDVPQTRNATTYSATGDSTPFTLTRGNHTVRLTLNDGSVAAFDKISFKTDALVVADKEALQAEVNEANTIDLDQYINDGKDTFTDALANAQAVLADEEATQAQVNSALNNLKLAISGLVPTADKTLLANAIELAKGLDLDNYVSNYEKEALPGVIADAEELLNNPDALQNEVNYQTEDLLKVVNGLVEKADKTDLDSAIADAEAVDTELYTENTVKVFTEALETAKTVSADEFATTEDVNIATIALQEAQAKLVTVSSVKELENLIAESEGLDLEKYQNTEGFAEAIEAAKAVLNDENATQEDINAALTALRAANGALVPIKTDIPNDGKGPESPTTVATGDHAMIMPIAAVCVIAFAGLSVLVYKKKKERME